MYSFPEKININNIEPLGNYAKDAFFGVADNIIFYTVKDGQWSDPSIWQTIGGAENSQIPNGINHSVILRHTVRNTESPLPAINIYDFHVLPNVVTYLNNTTINVYGMFWCESLNWAADNGYFNLYGNYREVLSFRNDLIIPPNSMISQIRNYNGYNVVVNKNMIVTGEMILKGRYTSKFITHFINCNLSDNGNNLSKIDSSAANATIYMTGCVVNVNALFGEVKFYDCNVFVRGEVQIIRTFQSNAPVTLVSGNDSRLRIDTNLDANSEFLISGSGASSLVYWAGNSNTKRILSKKITGENSSNELIITGESLNNPGQLLGGQWNFRMVEQVMETGILTCAAYSNVLYDRDGNQEIKGTTYYNLTFGGSGIKKLMGDVTVTNTYTLSGTATVDLNGFTLTTP